MNSWNISHLIGQGSVAQPLKPQNGESQQFSKMG